MAGYIPPDWEVEMRFRKAFYDIVMTPEAQSALRGHGKTPMDMIVRLLADHVRESGFPQEHLIRWVYGALRWQLPGTVPPPVEYQSEDVDLNSPSN
jgi:hypothetical protein